MTGSRALKIDIGNPAVQRQERLGAILVRRGVLAAADLDRVVELQRSSGKRLGGILIENGLVAPDEVSSALAEQLGIPCPCNSDLIQPRPPPPPRNYRVLPLALDGAEAPRRHGRTRSTW